MNKEIYVVTHKKYRMPRDVIYKPVVAGAFEHEDNEFPDSYLKDNTLDNISTKHDLYSEYTVAYWAWKNSKADIIGINHYRRYFLCGNGFTYFLSLCSPKKIGYNNILDSEELDKIFSRGIDCILPKKQWRVNRTVRQEFVCANSSQLLDATEKILRGKYPEYVNSFLKVMDSTENYQKCICIMKKEAFDTYMDWLFAIFSHLEKEGYGNGKHREFAFLGERLINVWLDYQVCENGLKVQENYFINVEFPIWKIFQNYTEFILPNLFIKLLKINNYLGWEVVIGQGKCKIQRRRRE